MKVLLCTITVGEGLNKICKAVAEQLDSLNIQNQIINVFENYPERTKANSKRYYKAVKFIPTILRTVTRRLARYDRDLNKLKNYNLVKKDVAVACKVLEEKINTEKFDVVYTPVASIALAAQILKQQGKINTKIIYNIPDFNIPYNVELLRDIDAIVTPCAEITKAFIDGGFNEQKINELKIPINPKFLIKTDKLTIREQLSISSDKFTVLIMSGGVGTTKNCKIIKEFAKIVKNAHFIVVNGNNKVEKNKIDKLINKNKLTNVTNLGFCTNVDELMSASDVIFTKLGAATLCESYAKDILIVTTKQILYPEYDNMLHLQKHNAILIGKNLKQCAVILNKIASNQIDTSNIKNNMQQVFDKESASKIANLIINI